MAIDLKTFGERSGSSSGSDGSYCDVHLGGDQPLAVLVREQEDRLGVVPHDVLGEARLVVGDERDDVAAGDVAVVDDGEPGRVGQQADRPDAPARDRRSDRPAVEHARESRDRRCTSPPR